MFKFSLQVPNFVRFVLFNQTAIKLVRPQQQICIGLMHRVEERPNGLLVMVFVETLNAMNLVRQLENGFVRWTTTRFPFFAVVTDETLDATVCVDFCFIRTHGQAIGDAKKHGNSATE